MVADPSSDGNSGDGRDGQADWEARDGLTVIIPHLNAPEGLARCLASLAAERAAGAEDVEVVVVDNGSAHRPTDICGAYPFVRLVDEAEPGPGPARNRGVQVATTPIVAFIDADCVARPGWVREILRHFTSGGTAAVIGGDVRIARVDPAHPTAVEAYESVYGYRMKLYIERDHYTATCNMAVRREDFLAVGGFAGINQAEDVDWGRRATAMGLGILYVPAMTIETPARASFAELARKWDRHIAHDYKEVGTWSAQVRWTVKSLFLAGSPVFEMFRILSSDRLSGLRERCLALVCLTRIRFYRSRRMLGLQTGFGRPTTATVWRDG